MTAYTCDISQQAEVEELVERLRMEPPDISVLVNNAGIQYNDSFIDREVSWSRVQEEIGINLVAPIALISRLLPQLSAHEEAAIVNVTSGLGLVSKKSAPVYCASKAGLHLFTQALRYQLEATQIKVFEIIPPIVDTAMTRGRGRDKISADQLAEEFWRSYRRNRLEARIGKVKLLMWLHRLAPPLAQALLKNS